MSDPVGAARIAIETSTRQGSVAIEIPGVAGAGQIEEFALDPGASHGADLLPVIAGRMEAHGLHPRAIELVVLGRGPGSYTGLRVGAATALGLMRGTGASLVGVPSFDALAADLAPRAGGQPFAIARNAFGGQLYVAIFPAAPGADAPPGEASPSEAQSVTAAEAAVLLQGVNHVLGDSTALRLLGGQGIESARLDETPPGAGALLRLGLRRFQQVGDEGAAAATPLYLRPFEVKVRQR